MDEHKLVGLIGTMMEEKFAAMEERVDKQIEKRLTEFEGRLDKQ